MLRTLGEAFDCFFKVMMSSILSASLLAQNFHMYSANLISSGMENS